jgi:hypothetical protein
MRAGDGLARLPGLALCGALSACLTQGIPAEAYHLQGTSLETREAQTRSFSVPSEEVILAAAVAMLQDLEYNLDAVERPLGVLSASKVADADSKSEQFGLIMLDALCAGAGGNTCNASTFASDSQEIRLTLLVFPSLAREGEYAARVTLQRVILDKQARVKSQERIEDPRYYQQILDSLAKSIYVQVSQ